MEEPKGFFTTLYDFNFSEPVTTKMIQILFGMGILAAAIGALWFIIWGFQAGFFVGLFTVILSPFVFVILSIMARVCLEIILTLFRIAENTSSLVQSMKK